MASQFSSRLHRWVWGFLSSHIVILLNPVCLVEFGLGSSERGKLRKKQPVTALWPAH